MLQWISFYSYILSIFYPYSQSIWTPNSPLPPHHHHLIFSFLFFFKPVHFLLLKRYIEFVFNSISYTVLCKHYDNFLCCFSHLILTFTIFKHRLWNIINESSSKTINEIHIFKQKKNEMNYWRIFLFVLILFVFLRNQLSSLYVLCVSSDTILP